MHRGKMVFPQVMAMLPWRRFPTCVERYRGDQKIKSLSCREFFLVMAFAQITGRESWSSTALCLNVLSSQCYHIGIRSKITKNNLAHANNKRNWKIFFDFAQILIKETTKLYRNDHIKLDINEGIYALDSTTIDLCLTLFPWAHFRKTKSAIKMHTMINLKGKIPALQQSCKKQHWSLFPRVKRMMSMQGIIWIGSREVGMSWIVVTSALNVSMTFINARHGSSPAVKRTLCTSACIPGKLTKAKASYVIKKCGWPERMHSRIILNSFVASNLLTVKRASDLYFWQTICRSMPWRSQCARCIAHKTYMRETP